MKKLHWIFLLAALISQQSCRKPSRVNIIDPTTYADTAFSQEYHEGYPLDTDDKNVRSIAIDSEDNVWITTRDGVFLKKKSDKQWTSVFPNEQQGPSFDVKTDQHSVWVSTWSGVYRYASGNLDKMPGPIPPVSTLCISAEGTYALGPTGAWLYAGDKWQAKEFKIGRSIRDAVSDNNGGLWVGTDVGLYHCTSDSTQHFLNKNDLISAYIRGVALNGKQLWAGGLGGITKIDNNTRSGQLSLEDGIPSINVNCIQRSPDGVMWVGTDVGVVRYRRDGSHSLLFSRRWLMDDKINDIAFDSKGNAWIATADGVSSIKRKPMTLASKQQYFYDVSCVDTFVNHGSLVNVDYLSRAIRRNGNQKTMTTMENMAATISRWKVSAMLRPKAKMHE
jgi:ligand-binding sensor domain-containing protein